MKKMLLMLGVLLLGVMGVLAGVDPKITILKPDPGTYFRCDSLEIKWSHSAYFDPYHQTCVIFCGSNIISPPVQVTADSFTWTVGMKADGTYFSPGSYKITIESPDYDALSGPTITIAEAEPKITITAPAGGATLTMGTKCMIRWNSSAYYKCWDQTCEVFCGETVISPPVLVREGQFEWMVGTKVRGVDIVPGDHQITLESLDYDCLNGPHVTLSYLIPHFHIKRFIEKIPLHKIPGCPMCFQIDPRELKFEPVDQEPVTIEIVRGRQVLARLGKFGRGLALPGLVRIVFDQESHGFLMKRRQGFELRIISAQGKIIHQQAIQLEIAR